MKVAYQALPQKVRDTIARVTTRRTQSAGVHVVPRTMFAGTSIGAKVMGAVVLLVALIAFVAPPPPTLGYVIGVGVCVVAGLMIARLLFFHVRARSSEVRPAVVFNPVLVAIVGLADDPVEMHYLRDLVGSDISQEHHAGRYLFTRFSLRFRDGHILFLVKSQQEAQAAVAYLNGARTTLLGWHQKGQLEDAVRQLDWIQAVEDAGRADAGKPSFWARSETHTLVGAAAGLVLGFLVVGLNLWRSEGRQWSTALERNTAGAYDVYLDEAPLGWHRAEALIRKDDLVFKSAAASERASRLRDYMETFPEGQHVADARKLVRGLYEQAYERYEAKADKAHPEAAASMKALLTYLPTQDSPRVGITFAPATGFEGGAIEQELARETGSGRVHSVSGSFTAERNRARESRIVEVMRASFRRVFADDLFALEPAEAAEAGARFLVGYTVAVGGDHYVLESENHLPASERQVFVGIRLHFDLALQVPGSSRASSSDPDSAYRFSTDAEPAPNIDITSETPSLVYDRMIATAFEQFEVELANAFGLELVMPSDWGELEGGRRRSENPFEQDFKFEMPELPPGLLPPGLRPPPAFELPDFPEEMRDFGKIMDRVLESIVASEIEAAKDEDPYPVASVLAARVKTRMVAAGHVMYRMDESIAEAIAKALDEDPDK